MFIDAKAVPCESRLIDRAEGKKRIRARPRLMNHNGIVHGKPVSALILISEPYGPAEGFVVAKRFGLQSDRCRARSLEGFDLIKYEKRDLVRVDTGECFC